MMRSEIFGRLIGAVMSAVPGPKEADGITQADIDAAFRDGQRNAIVQTVEEADSGVTHMAINGGDEETYRAPDGLKISIKRPLSRQSDEGADPTTNPNIPIPAPVEAPTRFPNVSTPEGITDEPVDPAPEDAPTADPNVESGLTVSPTPEGATYVAATYTLEEARQNLDALGLPDGAVRYAVQGAERMPYQNQLPETVFNIDIVNRTAIPMRVSEDDITIKKYADGHITLEINNFNVRGSGENQAFIGPEIRWFNNSGWASEQLRTQSGLVSIWLDTGSYQPTGNENYSFGFDLVYAIRWFDRSELEGPARDLLNDPTVDLTPDYQERYGPQLNPLSQNPETREPRTQEEILEGQAITAFAYYKSYIETGNDPDLEYILEINRLYTETNEPLVVQTSHGEWDLRAGLSLVFVPAPELSSEIRPNGGLQGTNFVEIVNGRLVFTQIAGGGTSSWSTTVAIPSAVTTAISDEGLEDPANFDIPEVGSLLYTPGIILTQDGTIELLLTPWESNDSSGGSIYGVNE